MMFNGFSFKWSNNIYMFPPIPVINKTIIKFQADGVHNGILITPAWPGLTTIPIIISLSIADPIFIPASHLMGPWPTRHPFSLFQRVS